MDRYANERRYVPHLPRFYGPVAQRVRYPNQTLSEPFIAPMARRHMERFALRIVADEWPEWQGCLDAAGRVDVAKMDAKIAADDFDSGSACVTGAHCGTFWSTTKIWARRCVVDDVQIGPVVLTRRPGWQAVPGDDPERALSSGELAALFWYDAESGFHRLVGLGIADPEKALARTVLRLAPQIEEWEGESA